jgi:hypothetical protein
VEGDWNMENLEDGWLENGMFDDVLAANCFNSNRTPAEVNLSSNRTWVEVDLPNFA